MICPLNILDGTMIYIQLNLHYILNMMLHKPFHAIRVNNQEVCTTHSTLDIYTTFVASLGFCSPLFKLSRMHVMLGNCKGQIREKYL